MTAAKELDFFKVLRFDLDWDISDFRDQRETVSAYMGLTSEGDIYRAIVENGDLGKASRLAAEFVREWHPSLADRTILKLINALATQVLADLD
jgi:hypothetical protein